MLNYVLPIAVSVLALFYLAKDWVAHKTTWRRVVVSVLIVLIGIGGAVNNYYSNRKVTAQHAEDQKRIAALKQAVDTANQNQQANTKQFVDAFGKLSQKVSDLQTQVTTEALQKKLASVQVELQKTQQALSPPKAELEAYLGELTETLKNGVQAISVPESLDGTVEFTISVANKSSVQAKNGGIYLRICEECEFVTEPKRFSRPEGAPNYDRNMIFGQIDATTGIVIPLKVKAPLGTHSFEVDVTTRCENCTVRPKDSLFINH